MYHALQSQIGGQGKSQSIRPRRSPRKVNHPGESEAASPASARSRPRVETDRRPGKRCSRADAGPGHAVEYFYLPYWNGSRPSGVSRTL